MDVTKKEEARTISAQKRKKMYIARAVYSEIETYVCWTQPETLWEHHIESVRRQKRKKEKYSEGTKEKGKNYLRIKVKNVRRGKSEIERLWCAEDLARKNEKKKKKAQMTTEKSTAASSYCNGAWMHDKFYKTTAAQSGFTWAREEMEPRKMKE